MPEYKVLLYRYWYYTGHDTVDRSDIAAATAVTDDMSPDAFVSAREAMRLTEPVLGKLQQQQHQQQHRQQQQQQQQQQQHESPNARSECSQLNCREWTACVGVPTSLEFVLGQQHQQQQQQQ